MNKELMFEGAIKVTDAKSLHDITNIAKQKQMNPWNRLFDAAGAAAESGNNALVFDEEKEGVNFIEDRKTVKKILEDLGYTVFYERVCDSGSYSNNFHNKYMISW